MCKENRIREMKAEEKREEREQIVASFRDIYRCNGMTDEEVLVAYNYIQENFDKVSDLNYMYHKRVLMRMEKDECGIELLLYVSWHERTTMYIKSSDIKE